MRAAKTNVINQVGDEQGISIVVITVLLVVFVAMAALAVDISHLYAVRNELQNAADAGALAGAQVLFNSTGTAINTGANQIAKTVAASNKSENAAVEVNWTTGNTGTDVERGHWSFATRTFTPNDSTAPFNLWNYTTAELDASTDFINAVRVKTWRQSTPANSFFARIVGFNSFSLSAEAVAYIGFAGTLTPLSVDQPIAICENALKISDEYTCSVGRMLNSGNTGTETTQTGGFTSFEQPCQGKPGSTVIRDLVCGSGNPNPLNFGQGFSTTNGLTSNFSSFACCWMSRNPLNPSYAQNCNPDKLIPPTNKWPMTLPVVDCTTCVSELACCPPLVGAVTVDVLWITDSNDCDASKIDEKAPKVMEDWSSNLTDGKQRWDSFVARFNMRLPPTTGFPEGQAATYANNGCINKSIYFAPDCTPHEPTGRTGGKNFGILAKTPVLVN